MVGLRLRTSISSTLALVAASAGLVALSAAPAHAVTLSVSRFDDVAPGTGYCAPGAGTSSSVLTLREALCIADRTPEADTLLVPAGTYQLTHGPLMVATTPGTVAIEAVGAGRPVITTSSPHRLVEVDPTVTGGAHVVFQGIDFRSGRADDLGGGAILAGSDTAPTSSLTIIDSSFEGNQASGPGGAVQMYGGDLTVRGSRFVANASQASGSAVMWAGVDPGDTVLLEGSQLTSNTVSNTYGGAQGGALALFGSHGTATVTGSSFVGNTGVASAGPAYGAAVFQATAGTTATVRASTLRGNTVSGAGSLGPAVTGFGSMRVVDSVVVGNTGGTGAVHRAGGTLDARNTWWGCNSGPGHVGCDATSGVVDAGSPIRLTATASPATLTGPSASSTITAALSGGVDTTYPALQGHEVTFADPAGDAVVGGSAGAKTRALASGSATIGYDSGTASGETGVVASLDNATVTAALTVQRPPALSAPASATLRTGEPASVGITATGHPVPTITRTGALPAGLTFSSAGGTATISGTPTQPGSFPLEITASNGVGAPATRTLTLDVGTPPAFTSASTARFTRGEAGSFTVGTSGTPTVGTITLTGTLPAGLTFTDHGDGTATVAGTPTGAAGTSTVTLTAGNGLTPDATQSLTVTVDERPAVTLQPSSQVVRPGATVYLDVAATGSPAPAVQWQRSTDAGATWADLAGATTPTYSFDAVRADDGHRFRAVLTNRAGTATSATATVRVGEAPAFQSAASTRFRVGVPGSWTVQTAGVPAATISGTGLPGWLTLTDAGDGTATLTGTPPAAAAGIHAVTLTAGNGFDPAATQSFTLYVDASPRITSADAATLTVGSAAAVTVTTEPGAPTATALSLTGTLPAGLVFTDRGDGTATLTGTPEAGSHGSYPVTVSATATGGTAPAAQQTLTLTVRGPARFTSPGTARLESGRAGSFTVTTAAGLPAARTLSLTGALPDGVTFTDHGDGTATLGGTPAPGSGGVHTLQLTADNGVAPAATQDLVLTVDELPQLSSADRATFRRGVAGSFTVVATPGHPAATTLLAQTPDLPPGLAFVDHGDGTATISGTPTSHGSWTVRLSARNALGTTHQDLRVSVEAPPALSSADATTFDVGTAGSFTVTSTAGHPVARALEVDGDLPDGVAFTDRGDGTAVLAGTPAVGSGGRYPLTLTVSNGVGPGEVQAFVLTVRERVAFTSADSVVLRRGEAATYDVTTAGGHPGPASLAAVAADLPPGLSFQDDGDGTATLSGTPGVAGTWAVRLSAGNPAGTTEQRLVVSVHAPATITSPDRLRFTAGSATTRTVTSDAGFPVARTLTLTGDLPDGLTFTDAGDGTATISGTPAPGSGGEHLVRVTADNGVGPAAVQDLTVEVDETPTITSTDRVSLVVGSSSGHTVTTTPGHPVATTLTVTGALPGGVTFTDRGDGTALLAGRPLSGTAGRYDLTVRATNRAGTVEQALRLTVARSGQTITVTSVPPSPAYVGDTYTPEATSSSGGAVAVSVAPGPACSVAGGTVALDAAGTCTVLFDQGGDGTHDPAGQVEQRIEVARVPSTLVATSSASPAVYGEELTLAVDLDVARGPASGAVQVSVDGRDQQLLPLADLDGTGDGSWTVPLTLDGQQLGVGSHTVAVAYLPSDPHAVEPAQVELVQEVRRAQTSMAVRTDPDGVQATVAVVAPGGGEPQGVVEVTVDGQPFGTAELVDGVARLDRPVPTGSTRTVAATYAGSASHAGTSATVTRADPRLVKKVSSRHGRSAAGWFRAPVRIQLRCVERGAPLLDPCPDEVVLDEETRRTTVERTVVAADGGAATVRGRFRIDLTGPEVRIELLPRGPVCRADDALSGLRGCRVRTMQRGGRTVLVARAVDRAGNTTRTRQRVPAPSRRPTEEETR